jgi:hypothetical protein
MDDPAPASAPPASGEALRRAQVARKLSRAAAQRSATGACARCSLRARYCVCAALVALPPAPAPAPAAAPPQAPPPQAPPPQAPPPQAPPPQAPPPPPRLFVSLVVAAFELGRASSTHKLVAATLGARASRSFVLDSEAHGGAREIWAAVREQARQQRQRVCFLFPSREARRFPDLCREAIAAERAAATAAPAAANAAAAAAAGGGGAPAALNAEAASAGAASAPVAASASGAAAALAAAVASAAAPRTRLRAALHVVAFDGTWKGARRMHRVMLAEASADAASDAAALAAEGDAAGAAAALAAAPCDVVVRNAYRFSLFQPLRRQPTPERVSTLEAVACCYDDWQTEWERGAVCTAGAGDGGLGALERADEKDGGESGTDSEDDSDADEDAAAAATPPAFTASSAVSSAAPAASAAAPAASAAAPAASAAAPAAMPAAPAFSSPPPSAPPAAPAALGALAHAHAHDKLIAACPSYASRALRLNLCCLVDQLSREKGALGREFGRGPGYRSWRLPASEVGAAFASLPAHLLERIAVLAYGRDRVLASGYALHASRGGWAASGASGGGGGGGEPEATAAAAAAAAPAAAAAACPAPARRRRLCVGGLPAASPFTRGVALALTNSHLFCLLAGERKLDRVVGAAAARRAAEKDAESAATRAALASAAAGVGASS